MSEQIGKVIMFDGPDGVGKTTQLRMVQDELADQGYDVYTSRFQGGTPMGDELARVSSLQMERQPLTDHHIAMAIRTELLADITKRRQIGQTILLDRSTLSSWAYQVFGSELEAELIDNDLDAEIAHFKPDLILCYKATVSTLRKHMVARARATDYWESKSDGYFERLIAGYDFAAKRYNATVIDAEADIPVVFERTMKAIRPLFNNQ